MKKATFLLLISSLTFFGCHSSSSSGTSVTPASMTATVSGHSFAASGNLVTAVISSSNLAIAGVTSANATIMLTLTNVSHPAVGTTSIDDTHAMAIYGSGPGSVTNAVYGTVTLTAVSPNLVGTFSFTCADSTKVVGGAFTVKAP